MSAEAIELSSRDRHFSKYVLGGLALFALVVSLSEQDRRALFLSDLPEAFAVSELQPEVTQRYPIVWGDAMGGAGGVRRPATRGSAAPTGMIGAPADTASPGVGAFGGPAEPTFAAATPDSVPPTAPALPGGSGPSLGSIPSFGGGTGPIAGVLPSTPVTPTPIDPGTPTTPVTPTDPGTPTNPGTPTDPSTPVTPNPGTDPVVPAVPEPASWLLMLIGVGALGAALRRRRRTLSEPVVT